MNTVFNGTNFNVIKEKQKQKSSTVSGCSEHQMRLWWWDADKTSGILTHQLALFFSAAIPLYSLVWTFRWALKTPWRESMHTWLLGLLFSDHKTQKLNYCLWVTWPKWLSIWHIFWHILWPSIWHLTSCIFRHSILFGIISCIYFDIIISGKHNGAISIRIHHRKDQITFIML